MITEHRVIFKTLIWLGPYIAVQLESRQNFSFIYVQTGLHFPFNLPCSHIFLSDCTIIYFLVCLQHQKYNCTDYLHSNQQSYIPLNKKVYGASDIRDLVGSPIVQRVIIILITIIIIRGFI